MNYESLNFANNFMFAKVMRNPALCRELLEVILDVEIEKIEYPEEEKVIDIAADAKSVRLDVYVNDDKNTVYNVEMQATDTKELPKRSRYYQDMIDLNLIEKGQPYDKLNKSYVIFICMFDVFGKGRHIYTFENVCLQDSTLSLGDETTKVFLNPRSDMNDVDEELGNFLK
jgi:predicted transposase/invertase (TIGR01784 family)